MMSPPTLESAPPETWLPARRAVEKVLRPVERFLHVQTASGIVLVVTAIIALAWANSPFGDVYERVWQTPVSLSVGELRASASLHFLINDVLMVVFFFVVGLEIRREMHEGELSQLRRAALPAIAALGGMVAPACIFLLLNRGLTSQHGWGIPMATDIAFAVGILALLGNRVPAALRVLLLALAIIDDIGAIVVIALFYSGGISVSGLLLAGAGVLLVLVLQLMGFRRAVLYIPAGVLIWLGCHRAGIHPTISGVILGLLTPARTWLGRDGFLAAARKAVDDLRGHSDEPDSHGGKDVLGPLREVDRAQREAVAPVVRLQTLLHPWVAFGIMPLFALANAGVNVAHVDWKEPATVPTFLGVALGLLLGKPIGIVLVCAIAIRSGLAASPIGINLRGLAVVGLVAGIGFTMAIFIAELAFTSSPLLGVAKAAVLASSVASGLATLALGRILLRGRAHPDAADTPSRAEASTEL